MNKDFLYVLRDIVSSARKRIYVATYIASRSRITEDIYYAIADRVRRGVDVKIVLNGASEEALKFNKETVDFLYSIGVKHVKLTQRFTHIKLYIVDNYFIIGSHNLSGSPFMNRFEISIMIHSKDMADNLSNLFNDLILYEDTRSLIYRGIAFDVYYEVLVNYRILRDIYQKTFFSSERIKVLMYIATLSTATKKYYSLLLKKQNEGVKTAVLLNGASKLSRRYNEQTYNYLKGIGLNRVMLSKNFIHAKLLILDDTVVVGSHNLTAASVAGRLELSLAINSSNLANALDYVFEDLWMREEKQISLS